MATGRVGRSSLTAGNSPLGLLAEYEPDDEREHAHEHRRNHDGVERRAQVPDRFAMTNLG